MNFTSEATWIRDPKHLVFTFARYKFVSKMLTGLGAVAEIGAGDGIASEIVAQTVKALYKIDLKPALGIITLDLEQEPLWREFDGIYALDVLEHIADEHSFMRNICKSLTPQGTVILGLPSKESQIYASPESKQEHINCKTEQELRELMLLYFSNVYLFGMNDETLHTGFGPMCHYRLALATNKLH
jgi:hypothetical protein